MRGLKLHAINATTGEGIWKITGNMAPGAVSDGYLTASDSYDGHMYVFGKGKSATTVTAPQTTVPKGEAVLVQGTVLDMSPAQPGTPCVSKDSMATQMEYLHMQHPIDGLDHDIQMTGVSVSLTAIDSNGNVVDIGVATSSAYYGTFEKAWTPPAEGTYKVIASFAGDESYGSSAASTAVSVGPAAETTEPPATTVIPDYTWTIIAGVLVVIIAVAIVGILLYRKKS
jgi:outer membrane protein assembly factor BamB